MMSMFSKENTSEIFKDIKKNLIRGVKDRKHLADILRVLRQIKTVSKVSRNQPKKKQVNIL